MRSGYLAVALTVVVMAIAGSSASAHDGRRVQQESYVSHGIFIAGHGNLGGQHGPHLIIPEDTPGIVFQPKAGERFVKLSVADAVSGSPLVFVRQEVPGESHPHEFEFCAPTRHFRLENTRPLEVWVLNGFCTNHTWGVATTGTITATFSRN